jgi:hypothetical protein
MKKMRRYLVLSLTMITVLSMTIWGTLVIYYTFPGANWFRYCVSVAFCLVGLVSLIVIFKQQRYIKPLAPFGCCFAVVLIWWSMIEPSNNRDWQRDVARLPSAEIAGDLITLKNIRNFEYRSEIDYTEKWYDKTVDLNTLKSLDLLAVYWMGDAIAHTMLSFNFGGDYIVISIEIRKEKGETFSALAGFFRRYELTYVVADERDLIGLRTNFRSPNEDVYLYRINAKPGGIRDLFLQYVSKINELKQEPEFYNTAITNCTTNIVTKIKAIGPSVPFSWKMMLSGYFPELVYERGAMDQSIPFPDLRRKSLINERARKAINSDDFSNLIRRGMVGFPPPNS